MGVATAVRRAAWAAALVAAAAGVARAQATGGNAATVSQQTVRTGDGWSLPVTYFKSAQGKESPVVVLLHGTGGSRQVFGSERGGFAKALQDRGYAVVTVDLRKHGEAQAPAASRGPAKVTALDYGSMVTQDLEAVKAFLMERHEAGELNVRKLGIVAAGDTAPVAANYALADWLKTPYPDAPTLEARTPRGQDVQALVFLSPTENAGRATMGKVLGDLRARNVAAFIAVGAEDREDRGTARKVYDRLGGADAKDRVFLESYEQVKDRGTDLLGGRTPAPARIVAFLDKQLKERAGNWVSRKSRL